MKRIISTAMLAVALIMQANAQTMDGIAYDFLNWSGNTYGGSARTAAMGNAVTAAGSDLGSIIFNPAGSAVAPYSQISLTPGVSISLDNSCGTDRESFFGNSCSGAKALFIFPNGGFNISVNTGRESGLKRISFGVTANSSGFYNDGINCSGTNCTTSYAGYLANFATRNNYQMEHLRNYNNVDYATATAFNSSIIAHLDDVGSNCYIGTTENYRSDKTISLGGPIDQTFSRSTEGSKMDYVFNFAMNIDDFLFFGANLGIQSLNYKISDCIGEKALDSDMFQTGFSNFSYSYAYKCSGTGVYGKFGFLVLPVKGLRVGAAIQTPTTLNIHERYGHSSTNNFYNSSCLTRESSSSPESSWEYKMESPFRYNIGLAYTFSRKGIVSVDYEMVDYSMIKGKATYSSDVDYFNNLSSQMKSNFGLSHLLRAGAEYKITDSFAVRAGYSLTTNGECTVDEYGNKKNIDAPSQTVSAGFGYDSAGSFFCDIAATYSFLPSQVIQVYNNYISGYASPSVKVNRNAVNVFATIGWRF